MPWKEETIMSLKEEFAIQALSKEKPFSKLCQEFNITRKTGYRLLRQYEKEGVAGLAPRSKRPLTSPTKTSDHIEEAVINLRLKQPTWGPRKIVKYLSNKGYTGLPAFSTVNSILKRHNLIDIEESLKRQKLIRFERERPNDLWQMDFKGKFQLLTKQSCYPLTIIDDYSRFSLSLKACANEQHITVKKQLIHVFEIYGLPNQINVDNGNPWGNSKLYRHTALTVWLMRLGIKITHSRPRHPQTNGKCERFHRTLKSDLISRVPIRTLPHAQKLFNEWRHHYNHERPHEAIDMDVPADRYMASEKKIPSKLPQIEYNSNAILRTVRGNGYISFNGREYLAGEAFKGKLIEIRKDEPEHHLALYFGQFKIYTYDY